MDETKQLSPGDRVRLSAVLPYLKTADPMPMLRPSDLVSLDEEGQVLELRATGTLAVRFRRGTFLMEQGWLRSSREEGS
ncbi:DUF3148 domain-containing protein [Synechococcus sp. RSCCF101]|uniref:DUF3148 domain-containing protein n=1 Tax=Synechococcus sp. RSCCF101 TaxID=2511069 RepID=UPI001247C269|nr:DUF3148 domain-containing protein [Synechococcus sp. RSCCF101]QEY31602.1 DUF3148 domain-containing protein [Synechococcus sp. RSCCF101]